MPVLCVSPNKRDGKLISYAYLSLKIPRGRFPSVGATSIILSCKSCMHWDVMYPCINVSVGVSFYESLILSFLSSMLMFSFGAFKEVDCRMLS